MNVQLKRDFASAIRKQLDRYAVWEPGAPLALGDYGVLRDKTLYQLGNIRALGVTFAEIGGNETPYQYQSKGTNMIEGHVSGSIQPSGMAAPLRLSLELRFEEERGIFIRAERSRVRQIEELRQVALKLRENSAWKFRWKLVTEVREVRPGSIIMGSTAGTSLKFEGEADLLEQFKIGSLKGGTALSFTGSAALQVLGVEGPIFFELSYLPRFWRGSIKQAAVPIEELPEEPYARLGTQMAIEDDDATDDT